MAKQEKAKNRAKDGLAVTGKPDDPAKKENLDTREEQLQAEDQKTLQQGQDDNDPALTTTRQAGQGSS